MNQDFIDYLKRKYQGKPQPAKKVHLLWDEEPTRKKRIRKVTVCACGRNAHGGLHICQHCYAVHRHRVGDKAWTCIDCGGVLFRHRSQRCKSCDIKRRRK